MLRRRRRYAPPVAWGGPNGRVMIRRSAGERVRRR